MDLSKLKILVGICKKVDIEEDNEFLSLVVPENEGRVTKDNFIMEEKKCLLSERIFLLPNESQSPTQPGKIKYPKL